MNTDKMRQVVAVVAAYANEVHQKRPWIKPVLLVEAQRHTATAKPNSTIENGVVSPMGSTS